MFVFLVVACEKKSQQQDQLPEWLEIILDESTNNDFCQYWSVTRYSFRDSYYYELFNPLSSCLFCDVYDEEGNRMVWDDHEDMNAYVENRTDVTLVWECDRLY